MFTNYQDNPFEPLFQFNLLAILLQDPSVYQRYQGIWKPQYFAANSHHDAIARAYINIRSAGHEHPTKDTILQELSKHYELSKPLPMDVQAMKKECETLYDASINNINYSIDQLCQSAQGHEVFKALEASIDFLQSNKIGKIRERMDQALSIGSDMADIEPPEYFTLKLPPRGIVIPGLLQAGGIGLLSARSKACKTWNLICAAIAVAMGKSWLGFDANRPGKALYIGFELHREGFQDRMFTRKGYKDNSLPTIAAKILARYQKDIP